MKFFSSGSREGQVGSLSTNESGASPSDRPAFDLDHRRLDQPVLSPRGRESYLQRVEELLHAPALTTGELVGSRAIAHSARGKQIGLFPSRKARGFMRCESSLETRVALLLERAKSVTTFRNQAPRIELSRREAYTADFIIKCADGRYVLVEVKPTSHRHLMKPQLASRLARIESQCLEWGIPFYVVGANDLGGRVFHSNLAWLHTRAGLHDRLITVAEINCARDMLRDQFRNGTLLDLRNLLSTQGFPACLAERLLFSGWLHANMCKQLTLASQVTL